MKKYQNIKSVKIPAKTVYIFTCPKCGKEYNLCGLKPSQIKSIEHTCIVISPSATIRLASTNEDFGQVLIASKKDFTQPS